MDWSVLEDLWRAFLWLVGIALVVVAAVAFCIGRASAADSPDSAVTVLRGELKQTRSGELWVSVKGTSSTCAFPASVREQARALVGRRVIVTSEFNDSRQWVVTHIAPTTLDAPKPVEAAEPPVLTVEAEAAPPSPSDFLKPKE